MKKSKLLLLFMLPFCVMAQVFYENTTLEIEKVPVNTLWSDFGPSFVENELWYSGFLPADTEKINQGRTRNIYYKLFSSAIDNEGHFVSGRDLVGEEASSGYHAGPVSYCKNTGELFMTLSNYDNAEVKNIVFQRKKIPLKIVILTKSGNNWKISEELPFNSSLYSIGHPAVSPTGDTLIFASDIPGKGYGGTDLYMSVRKNGKWGEMINLGDKINTSGDDMFPFLHKGNVLLYASNGQQGSKGGFDVYYATREGNGFSKPVNLDGLNSNADDFGLVVHPNEEVGYFVSNREGGSSNDDIYKVSFKGTYGLELVVKNRVTGEPVPGVTVNFNDNTQLTTNSKGLISRQLDKAADYNATTALEGYMNGSVAFTTKNKSYGILKKEIGIEKVETGQKFVMENIYYRFDKWDLLPESEKELDKLVAIMNDNPLWKVELGSHTDSRGSIEYNDMLSNRRSLSAVDYIVSRGISQNRITARGYGKTQLVNRCSDGINCTEDEHRMNRRTEFKILEM